MSEYEVLQVQAQPQVMQIDALERANVDTQVATAKNILGICVVVLMTLSLWLPSIKKRHNRVDMRYQEVTNLLLGHLFTWRK